jgi:5-enolpyruvylshikimate-3-phosphate synthase
VTIEDPVVVEKSYPGFWDDLRSVGFGVSDSGA